MSVNVDVQELETRVRDMYRHVAREPGGAYHFEIGRPLAERLGYPRDALDEIPSAAIESFAGVGYFFDLAQISEGERVLDLGSGAGTDVFFAAGRVGRSGRVVGVDYTDEQLAKARRLAVQNGYEQVEFRNGRIEWVPVDDESIDCVISNGVINLSPAKGRVFAEAARVLRPGGRLAIADIVTEQQLAESIVCDARLWASCIGGASQEDDYRAAIEAVGLQVEKIQPNPYEFLSDDARNASATYGVKSISLLAGKE